MVFPAVETDRRIQWKPQNSFGRGLIKVGEKEVSQEALREHDSRSVPAGQSVMVGAMDVRFRDPD
jgi:hypothetical protein